MPVKTCLSSLLSTRFEFGVPLEDVFPPNDIHPRLKYLFGKAYESYIKNGCNIEITLRQEQGSMKECLNLKEKLVLDLDYHINVEEFYPGSYFWVLRHFLGLLPLPLLPKYTKGIQFDWGNLADDCSKLFLQNYGTRQKDKDVLDYEIAQFLNLLPFENFMLINVLLVFLRKLSTKNVGNRQKFNRKLMLVLSEYFCSSIFVRPYRPGYHQLMNDPHLPLLLYLILRWRKICRHCESIGHPAFFLECDIKNLETYSSLGQKDSCTQTNILGNAFLNPEVISVCRNIPYFVNVCNNYLRDIGCQTDTNLSREKNGASYCPILEEYTETDDKENIGNSVMNETGKNGNDTDYKLAYIEEELDNVSENDGEVDENTLYQTATDFSFINVVNKGQDWQNIVKETMETVQKVEESYIYDDYETFKKEDFNQIGKNRSRSFLSKISKHGFTYTPSKKPDRHDAGITSTPKKESPDSDTSYVKYLDVCENVDLTDHRIDQCNTEAIKSDHGKIDITKSKKPMHQNLFQGDSPMDIQSDNSKQDLQNGGSNKKGRKYMLKRIRLSLAFLRALTPKKSTFKMIESRVKYHRMKTSKPYTV